MERVVKVILILVFSLGLCLPTMADNFVPTQMATPTDCVKTFPIGFEKLYYLTLSGINNYNYKVKEMQTKGGFILFVDNNNKVFLASIIYVSSSKSMLKLTPCDNAYNFTVGTPNNMFKYIEDNQLNNY